MNLRTCLALVSLFVSYSLRADHHSTKTPIKHLVVIFQENRAFDNYFGIYPYAENKKGETPFHAKKNTPTINGLSRPFRKDNQNLAQPFRFSPFNITSIDPKHKYTTLQQACDTGLMDKFVQFTGAGVIPPTTVMGYYDGNTVTALWNYAQHFALSDNFHTTSIAGSAVGAVNLISGQTHGVIPANETLAGVPVCVEGTLINNIDPKYDNCSVGPTVELTGINIGNLLNKQGITWGWFQGGFSNCKKAHIGSNGELKLDYVPHHNPFQYYKSTSNPKHLPPKSPKNVGKTDRANHNYDLDNFWEAAKEGNVPSVCFLKAPGYQDGHARYSTPLLEQQFLTKTINRLQRLPQWKDMAIIIAYDDSGGWYDHEVPPLLNQSQIFADAFVSPGNAGSSPPLGGYQGRPSYGFRVPFILISPWAKQNYVDNTLIDQTSILRFIEDNWKLKRIGNYSFDAIAGDLTNMFDFKKRNLRYLFLHQKTGAVLEFKEVK